jgi:hypothetical protein
MKIKKQRKRNEPTNQDICFLSLIVWAKSPPSKEEK